MCALCHQQTNAQKGLISFQALDIANMGQRRASHFEAARFEMGMGDAQCLRADSLGRTQLREGVRAKGIAAERASKNRLCRTA